MSSHRPALVARLLAPTVAVLTVLALALIVGVGRQAASAAGDLPGNGEVGLRGFEEYTEPGGVWPPRQTGIVADDPAATDAISAPEAQIASESDGRQTAGGPLTAALGERFERVASGAEIDAKGRPVGRAVRTTYFSYSHNATVDIVEEDGAIRAITSTPAAEKQPPRTESEQDRAVALARTALTERGHTRPADIEGYAILAYPHPDNDLPDPGTPHYDGRVLYVSFHIDALSDPEFAAWVDLTTETVLRAGEAA